jgi:hypothetical protein
MTEGRVVFNVGGKRYETTKNTIQRHEGSFLEMLVRRSNPDKEIFVDRDGKVFRWILYWYRTSCVVDSSFVGIPFDAWLQELDFFGIDIDDAGTVCGQDIMTWKERRNWKDGGQDIIMTKEISSKGRVIVRSLPIITKG